MKTPDLLEAGICQKRFARFVALAGEGVVMLAQHTLARLLHQDDEVSPIRGTPTC